MAASAKVGMVLIGVKVASVSEELLRRWSWREEDYSQIEALI
jgi:hypothetical protein